MRSYAATATSRKACNGHRKAIKTAPKMPAKRACQRALESGAFLGATLDLIRIFVIMKGSKNGPFSAGSRDAHFDPEKSPRSSKSRPKRTLEKRPEEPLKNVG